MPRPAALLLTPRFPWPLDDGGRVVLWQSLWATARTHDVTLISFVPATGTGDSVPEPVAAACARVVRVPHRPPPALIAGWRGLTGRWPYTLARYQDPAYARAVQGEVARVRPAFALVNHLHLAPYHESLGRVPMILRQHNAEHRWMASYARSHGPTPAGLYARIQARRLRAAERELCERAALVLAIQEVEADALRALAPRARVRTLPVGVSLERFLEPSPSEPPTVLLPGSFRWEPNVEGAIRFLERGWPRVRAASPSARLRVAGREPPQALRRAAERARAEIAADVPSMEEELSRASIAVVPLWVGAGARVKIVEAMAARVPVVATSLAAEGLELEPELHYLCADRAEGLGDAVAGLLHAPAERLRLAAQGRSLAESRWSMECVARRQEALIEEALGGSVA
ncbi:MAG TPA: glycosyltransferase family 4 protein [Candidatus Limnocylindrales bacterium]|nr:glycosyltransferase family 4 protein [Candidatus Limnocylindrales bacterium]